MLLLLFQALQYFSVSSGTVIERPVYSAYSGSAGTGLAGYDIKSNIIIEHPGYFQALGHGFDLIYGRKII
jgi:hypothetical protein